MRQFFLQRLLIAAGMALLLNTASFSQTGFNFNCKKDTAVNGCANGACFTLQTIIPDIHGSSATYTVNPATNIPACFPATVDPGGNGTPTNLTIDDRYSSAINIGFPFSFFGTSYTQLVASTNGYVCFDLTEAGQFSHWDIINGSTPQDLPSTFYDKGLIMGSYHDLDPSVNTSPGRKIQYSTIGTAPNRKWILSFYKVPLFSSACNSLIENTHQITIHEGTGIIEVYMYSQQICSGWNDGRAMIGLQNFTQNAAIMAPGRKASDAPWGTVGMNETWRFVPSGGASLFKRVEAYNLAGTLLATGTVASQPNGTYKTSFPNFCVPSGTNQYVVKSVYQKNDDPNVEVFGMDTVRVTVNNAGNPTATAAATATNCSNNNGTVTVTAAGGALPFQYSLNGGTFQSSNVFSALAQGVYNIVARDAAGCTASASATVALQNNLILTANGNASICRGASFTPTVAGNAASYSWSPATGVSNTAIANPTLAPQATTNYTVTGTLGVCTANRTFTLTVFEGATANAGPDVTIIAGDVIKLQATGSAGNYLWTPATSLSSSTILAPDANPVVTTPYNLKVTSPQGCIATDDVTITVVPYCVKPMEAFTPNGDGVNDLWLITNGTSCVTKLTAQVFNRYGSKVFESNDYKNNWSGTYEGKPLPDGTYYYAIRFYLINGKLVQLKGNLTILR
jgi:gliding motility-associated-like protein